MQSRKPGGMRLIMKFDIESTPADFFGLRVLIIFFSSKVLVGATTSLH